MAYLSGTRLTGRLALDRGGHECRVLEVYDYALVDGDPPARVHWLESGVVENVDLASLVLADVSEGDERIRT